MEIPGTSVAIQAQRSGLMQLVCPLCVQVWIWNLQNWVLVAPNFFSSYVNLVRTATNNFYILESLLGSGPESPTFIDSEGQDILNAPHSNNSSSD